MKVGQTVMIEGEWYYVCASAKVEGDSPDRRAWTLVKVQTPSVEEDEAH